MDYTALIDRIYENNNYPGYTNLIKLVQKEHPNITKTQIKKWHDAQLEVQLLHAQHKKKASIFSKLQENGNFEANARFENNLFQPSSLQAAGVRYSNQ